MSLFADEPKKRGSLDFDGIGQQHNSSTTDNEDSFMRGGSGGNGTGGSAAEEDDGTDGEPPWYAAPPNDYIDNIKGYEETSFDAVNVPPPVDLDAAAILRGEAAGKDGGGGEGDVAAPPPAPPPPIQLECEVKLTEDEARAALLGHLDNHCCYGKGAARNMVIKKMECLPAFHYELQTFSEKRETAWTYAPIRSGFCDAYGTGGGLGSGAPPLPWEIEEFPSHPFKDEVRLIPVPNTCSTKSCHRCRGTGGVLCKDCNGKGWYRCMHCHGDGWLGEGGGGGGGSRERCFYCHHSKHGHGHQDCAKCGTRGKVNCATCDGQGQVRCYIQLSITWKVHTAEHIAQRFELPAELIRDVSGQVAHEEETAAGKIRPLRASDADISAASARLVSGHADAFSDRRVVAQRHQVRVVPVTRVGYEWKGRQREFFVYGYENKVHLKKYPQDCCWGCQIL